MPLIKRIFLPFGAFLLGSAFIATFYIGILTWAQGWEYAASQLSRDRWYVLPIIIGFGIQAALYIILRFRLFVPAQNFKGVYSIEYEVNPDNNMDAMKENVSYYNSQVK